MKDRRVLLGQPQQALSGREHVEERAGAPAGGRLLLLLAERHTLRNNGAAIFHEAGLRGILTPAEQPAFINRMQGIDDHQRTGDRNSDRVRALAEAADKRIL
jgi:hypothetical protein